MNQATKSIVPSPVSRSRVRFVVTCCFVSVLLASPAAVRRAEPGAVRRAWLGVSMADMSASMQKMIGRDFKQGGDAGVRVAAVAANGPAAQAGLKKGDVILCVGATRMTSGRQVVTTVSRLWPGQTIDVTFLREVTVSKTRVVLGAIDADGRRSLVEPEAEGPSDPTEALFDASARGDAAQVAALIEAGADVRATNANGQVPLHVACGAGHTRAAKLLIDADQARGEAERGDTLIMSLDDYIDRTNPTLTAQDRNGNTPLHAAAQNGRSAAAKLLIESGADKSVKNRAGQTAGQLAGQRGATNVSDVLDDQLYSYEPPVDEPILPVTRYTPALRTALARVQDIERRLAGIRADRASQLTVTVLGTELHALGAELETLLSSSDETVTRIGTMEEADLVEAIKASYERAALALLARALAVAEEVAPAGAPQEGRRSGRSPTFMQEALRDVGRMLIEEQAAKWMRQNGLEVMLVEKSYSVLHGEVTRGIELNLRTFLDKKSTELIGMPLGGFRSIQAAFRLQARRAVRKVVADLILNISGNQLAVYLLQRHLVRWVETDLWPRMREAFRPKTHLARRVRISRETMEQARNTLNGLAVGRHPAHVPIVEVVGAVQQAQGKIAAARYLKRDLEKAQNQELIDALQEAEDLLRHDMLRVRRQFLIANTERWEELWDNVEFIQGVNGDVAKLLVAMEAEQGRIRAALEAIVRACVNESVAGAMAQIHEESPYRTAEVAGRIRQHFATSTSVSDELRITEIIKRSERDVEIAFTERVGSSREAARLVFRRSGETWKLYDLADGS